MGFREPLLTWPVTASPNCAQTGGSLRLTHLTRQPAQVLQISGVHEVLIGETP